MDVTHLVEGPEGTLIPAVDFVATVDTPYVWELNIWYHTLNAGFRTRISGETDFPCIYGERVGLGRSYCKLDGSLTFEDWCQSLSEGRNYASDGYSHLLDFTVDDVRMGENGSELQLPVGGKTVAVRLTVCAMLGEDADEIIAKTPFEEKPYWHIERARVKGTRKVPLEILVNGYPAIKTEIVADGSIQHCEYELKIPRSSWVAARILPSSHTNPIFVIVGKSLSNPHHDSIGLSRKCLRDCLGLQARSRSGRSGGRSSGAWRVWISAGSRRSASSRRMSWRARRRITHTLARSTASALLSAMSMVRRRPELSRDHLYEAL